MTICWGWGAYCWVECGTCWCRGWDMLEDVMVGCVEHVAEGCEICWRRGVRFVDGVMRHVRWSECDMLEEGGGTC